MSHSRERADKTCLNCHNQLHGRYCHICGQENIDPRESFWSIVVHFFNDFTHFDGKFFQTTGNLLAKPGFLPKEYIEGRRARYLHPIRMYLFTSFIFFLVFYSFTTPSVSNADVSIADSVRSSSRTIGGFRFNPIDTIVTVTGSQRSFKTVAEYDSAQKALSPQDRDNWLVRQFTRSNIERLRKYGGQRDSMVNSVIDTFYHRFPYLLFVSLPLSAFFLQILYFRNRNNLYSGHAVFLVYLYIFTFLSLLVYFGLDKIETSFNLGWIWWLKFALFVYVGLYTLFAFKRYYAQGWGKTIFKFIVFNILAFITIVILFVVFFLISLLTV